jgi:hypothetical protein
MRIKVFYDERISKLFLRKKQDSAGLVPNVELVWPLAYGSRLLSRDCVDCQWQFDPWSWSNGAVIEPSLLLALGDMKFNLTSDGWASLHAPISETLDTKWPENARAACLSARARFDEFWKWYSETRTLRERSRKDLGRALDVLCLSNRRFQDLINNLDERNFSPVECSKILEMIELLVEFKLGVNSITIAEMATGMLYDQLNGSLMHGTFDSELYQYLLGVWMKSEAGRTENRIGRIREGFRANRASAQTEAQIAHDEGMRMTKVRYLEKLLANNELYIKID